MNTATMNHYVDFSAESGLEYMLIDAGWAQRGTGPNDSGSDLTRPNPNIDMPAILAHAKAEERPHLAVGALDTTSRARWTRPSRCSRNGASPA